MGLFKQMKQMKDVVAGAPDMIEQAQQLQAAAMQQQAAAMQQQQQAMDAGAPAGGVGAATPASAPGALSGPDAEPIGGVSLELYAELSRELGARGYTQEQAPALAAERGIAAGDWHAAVSGWNQRMAANPAVALEFNRLYRGA